MKLDISEISKTVRIIRNLLIDLIGGSLIISTAYYAAALNNPNVSYGKIVIDFFDHIAVNPLKLVVFILFSYVVGFISPGLISTIRIPKGKIKLFKKKFPKKRFKLFDSTIEGIKYSDYVYLLDFLNEDKHSHRIEKIETIQSGQKILSTIGSATIISSLIFFGIVLARRDVIDIIIFAIFIIITVACKIRHRDGNTHLTITYKAFNQQRKFESINP